MFWSASSLVAGSAKTAISPSNCVSKNKFLALAWKSCAPFASSTFASATYGKVSDRRTIARQPFQRLSFPSGSTGRPEALDDWSFPRHAHVCRFTC